MPVLGITRIANITGLDSIGIPVTMVCRPNARSLAVSQGKGLDLVAAKVSGLMESVETYHAETITLPLKIATYEELRYTHTVKTTSISSPADARMGLFHPNRDGVDRRVRSPLASLAPLYDVVHVNSHRFACGGRRRAFSAPRTGSRRGTISWRRSSTRSARWSSATR